MIIKISKSFSILCAAWFVAGMAEARSIKYYLKCASNDSMSAVTCAGWDAYVADGARWQVLNATSAPEWYTSGWVSPQNYFGDGNYYIRFSRIRDFYLPASVPCTVAGDDKTYTNFYALYFNTLSVVIEGSSAGWQLTACPDEYTNSSFYAAHGGTGHTNSFQFSSIPTGTYGFVFNNVRGYATPPAASVNITGGPYAWFSTNAYIPYSNSLAVTVSGITITTNAVWALVGPTAFTNAISYGAAFTNSFTVSAVPTGYYTITFPPVVGFTTPAIASTNITAASPSISSITGLYTSVIWGTNTIPEATNPPVGTLPTNFPAFTNPVSVLAYSNGLLAAPTNFWLANRTNAANALSGLYAPGSLSDSVTTLFGLVINGPLLSNTSTIAIGKYATATNIGIAIGDSAKGSSNGVAIGVSADGQNSSVAVGYGSAAATYGAALGYNSDARSLGSAVGFGARGLSGGAALGYSANGGTYGMAIGYNSYGVNYGVAGGNRSKGDTYGVSAGNYANGSNYGVAIGNMATGSSYGVAIGANSFAVSNAVAIGYGIINTQDNSTKIKGNLNMAGASVTNAIFHGNGAGLTNLPLHAGANMTILQTPTGVVFSAAGGTGSIESAGTYPVFKLDLGLVNGNWTDFDIKATTNNFKDDGMVYYFKSWTTQYPDYADPTGLVYFIDDCNTNKDCRSWQCKTNDVPISAHLMSSNSVVQWVYFYPSHECAVPWQTWMNATNKNLIWSWVRHDDLGPEMNLDGTQQRWNPIQPEAWVVERTTP